MIQTVRINSEYFPAGLVINESDFDPSQHTLYGEKTAPEPEKVPEPKPAPRVIKKGAVK